MLPLQLKPKRCGLKHQLVAPTMYGYGMKAATVVTITAKYKIGPATQ